MNHRGLTCPQRKKGLLLLPYPLVQNCSDSYLLIRRLGLIRKGNLCSWHSCFFFPKSKKWSSTEKMWIFYTADLFVTQRDGSHQWWYFWWREKPLRGCGGLKPGDAHILLLLLLDIEILALVLRWLRCWQASGRSARQAHKWIHFSLAPSHGRAQCPSTQP